MTYHVAKLASLHGFIEISHLAESPAIPTCDYQTAWPTASSTDNVTGHQNLSIPINIHRQVETVSPFPMLGDPIAFSHPVRYWMRECFWVADVSRCYQPSALTEFPRWQHMLISKIAVALVVDTNPHFMQLMCHRSRFQTDTHGSVGSGLGQIIGDCPIWLGTDVAHVPRDPQNMWDILRWLLMWLNGQ